VHQSALVRHHYGSSLTLNIYVHDLEALLQQLVFLLKSFLVFAGFAIYDLLTRSGEYIYKRMR
jgi:hypothetical protein